MDLILQALKSSHAGISLSNAEASIASPFTSKTPNIECVPKLIKESRSTLTTSFGVVKFICMYSLTQFISVILLYTDGNNLSDGQFLYIDLVLITILAFLFSKNKPFRQLHWRPPSNKLIAWRPIFSLLFHTIFIFLIQFYVFIYVKFQPWYQKKEKRNIGTYEGTSLFIISSFQYITEAVIFSAGFPHRRTIFRNKLFISYILLSFFLNILIGITKYKILNYCLFLIDFPSFKHNLMLFQISVIHFFVSFLIETFLFDKELIRLKQ